MSPSPTPAYGRDKLLRILALPQSAARSEIRTAGDRLRGLLAQRLAERPDGSGASDPTGEPDAAREALLRELADLETSLAYWTSVPTLRPSPERLPIAWGTGATLMAVVSAIALMIAGAAALRSRSSADEEPAPIHRTFARLELEGPLEGATLRVLDADRSELIDERPAQGARVELEPGRVALEVRREDCPDVWTRSVFLEPDRVHRFRPVVCAGHGELVIRSNTAEDRVRIDDVDVGPTGPRAHRLTTGDHTVRVEKAGHRAFETRVRIEPGKTLELRAELAPVGAAASAARPLPVSHVSPSAPPVGAEAIEAFKQEVLASPLELPPLDPGPLDLPKRGTFLSREGLPDLPDGGSTTWHDRVAKQLRDRFDLDRSGEIDRLEESEAIPCSVWREIERDFDRGGLGLSLAHAYGFDGSEWQPGALSVARAHRSAVYARMRDCGLAP